MEIILNRVDGLDDAIVSMFLSKRTLTKELEKDIRETYERVCDRHGKRIDATLVSSDDYEKFCKWTSSLFKWGWKHVTMLKFIDLSFTVYGLHRAGQDDWDAHAKRMDNRIIRNSTRLATFGDGEMSDYYKDKIITTDNALTFLEIETPDKIKVDGKTYCKTLNGYILEEYKDNKDVKRGLYMLSIPSDFVFKINLAEFAHVYKERNANGTANPEVKECAESGADQICSFIPEVTKDYLLKILN